MIWFQVKGVNLHNHMEGLTSFEGSRVFDSLMGSIDPWPPSVG